GTRRPVTRVPGARPRTNDTNLDTRCAAMGVCSLWRMSLLGVYAYAWATEYVRYCLICCSFAAHDPPILFLPMLGLITNIVPTVRPMRLRVFVSTIIARSRTSRSVRGMPDPILGRLIVIATIISNG